MCLKTMDTKKKQTKPDYQRKLVSKLKLRWRWRLLRVSAVEQEVVEAGAVRMTMRKYLRRERLAKLASVLGDITGTETTEEKEKEKDCVHHRLQPGAMAPQNTTQYLMSHVYEDMKANNNNTTTTTNQEGLLSSADPYESCLLFQQRDFEDMFDSSW